MEKEEWLVMELRDDNKLAKSDDTKECESGLQWYVTASSGITTRESCRSCGECPG